LDDPGPPPPEAVGKNPVWTVAYLEVMLIVEPETVTTALEVMTIRLEATTSVLEVITTTLEAMAGLEAVTRLEVAMTGLEVVRTAWDVVSAGEADVELMLDVELVLEVEMIDSESNRLGIVGINGGMRVRT
jgi:hypothetical protein